LPEYAVVKLDFFLDRFNEPKAKFSSIFFLSCQLRGEGVVWGGGLILLVTKEKENQPG
jgi:hypothetical protein